MSPRATVDEQTLTLLASVAEAARVLRIPWLVSGAAGRALLLEDVYGLPDGRATEDVDFGVMVASWEEYERLADRLCADARFRRDPHRYHRLRLGGDRCLDLIPFGDIEGEDRTIRWPPRGDVVMNVAGFREAFVNAVRVRVNGRLTVDVVSPEGLVLLKLVAWRDRHRAQPRKDASDLAYVLRHYARLLSEEVLFEQHFDVVERVDYDLDAAAARVLGRRLAALCGPTTAGLVRDLLERQLADRVDSMLVREVGMGLVPPSGKRALVLLEQLHGGFRD